MNLIYKKLSCYLFIFILILMLVILLIIDISVDIWISGEFDWVMFNKVGLFEILVEEDNVEVEFDFVGEFMFEFEGFENFEYF